MNFYRAGGLEQFEYLSEHIFSLSPYDGLELPTATFYSQMPGVSDLSELEFVECLAIKTNYIRNRILTERLKQRRKNGSTI